MENVKIYEVKKSSVDNAKALFSPDTEYIYWHDKKFENDKIGDHIFFVDRYSRWALFTRLNLRGIAATHDSESESSSFTDENHTYTVYDELGDFKIFYRFKIIQREEIPAGWNWRKPIGRSETFVLRQKGMEGEVERIGKVDDLERIFKGGPAETVLEWCRLFLSSPSRNKTKTPPAMASVISLLPLLDQISFQSEYRSILKAIQTKPFVLLAGISGTGKSRLVRTLAYKTCAIEELRGREPGNFKLIVVKPNWHDSTELAGYLTRINGVRYTPTEFLKHVVKAWHYPQVPFFICLDEMNLAPVEQYFAEYLSLLETRRLDGNTFVTDPLVSMGRCETDDVYKRLLSDLGVQADSFLWNQFCEQGITLPPNLVVMGTVNMDETTHSFSRKVLDRAMTFEMNNVDLYMGLEKADDHWQYDERSIAAEFIIPAGMSISEVYKGFDEAKSVVRYLSEVNNQLERTPFKIAYRVRDEFLIYCYRNSLIDDRPADWLDLCLDELTIMKILSRIEGDQNKAGQVVRNLLDTIPEKYIASREKLEEMQTKLTDFGYTSYWS